MPKRITGDLQLGEDIDFQRRQWRAERVGWVAMAVVVLAAALGAFGSGPLSSTRAATGTLEVEFERFARWQAPTELKVSLPAEAATEEGVVVTISSDYLDAIDLESITPRPLTVQPGETFRFVFAAPPTSGASARFGITPASIGVATAQVGVDRAGTIDLWQLIYP